MAELSRSQRSIWDQARRYADVLNKEVHALSLRGENLLRAVQIGEQYGIVIPGAQQWLMDVEAAVKRDQRIQQTIADLLTGRIGLRDSDRFPGDLDVVAPAGTTDDALVQYYRGEDHFGFPWLIIAGVVVVVGLIAALLHEHQAASEYRNAGKPLLKIADELLCADPAAPACRAWMDEKRQADFQNRKSMYERLEEGAKKLFGALQVGLAIGIPIALAILVWTWTKKER
jgi:hypothetical protein